MSEDARTTEFRIKLMLELESASRHINALGTQVAEFKKIIFTRVDNHSERISHMEASLDNLVKAGWILFSATVVILVGAVLKLILK